MRIALITAGTRGDAQPMVVLGTELLRRGHDVIVGISPNLTGFVRHSGLEATPIGPDSQAFLESEEAERWSVSGNGRTLLSALGKVAHDAFATMIGETVKVCTGADLIVSGFLCEDVALCIGEAASIPVVMLHTGPHRPTRGYPSYVVTVRTLPGPCNRATAALFERTWWRWIMRSDINRLRIEMGLAPTTRSTPERSARDGLLELQAYSRHLVPRLTDYGPRRPIIGFLRMDASIRARLGEVGVTPKLDRWLSEDEPPVYFGWGSMPITNSAAALAMIEHVCTSLGVRALVSTGWSQLSDAAPVDQARVLLVGAIDHDAVLPRCRAAVHHGGAGTTAATLCAGLPTFVCSVLADQPFWGTRLKELGVGAHRRFAQLDRASLASGLQCIFDERTTAAASALGEVLGKEDGATSQAADFVEKTTA